MNSDKVVVHVAVKKKTSPPCTGDKLPFLFVFLIKLGNISSIIGALMSRA